MKPCILCGEKTDQEVLFPGGERALCPSCARKRGVLGPGALPWTTAHWWAALVRWPEREAGPGGLDAACPGCGTTGAEVALRGELGCPRCHETFRTLIPSLVRLRHAATPAATTLRTRLWQATRNLEAAVAQEDYEAAAHWRDSLAALGPGPDSADGGV